MQVHNSEALALTYGVTSTKTRNALAALSPLISEALALLEQPGQNPVYGPMPALQTVATELTKDERDLAWRVDWIKTTDAQPIGTTGRITAYAPSSPDSNNTFNLDAALTATGLTTAEQQHAKEAILGGEDFTDAIDAERKRTLDNNMAAFRRQEAQAWTEVEGTPIKGEEDDGQDSSIRDTLGGLWDRIPAKETTIPLALSLLFGGNKDEEPEDDEDRVFLGNLEHNINTSVVGSILTGRPSPEAIAKVIEHAPGVLETLDNAHSEIRSLNPQSPEGAQLLLSDPGQFVDNHINFLGGAKDWAVDSTKLAAAVTIAGSPALNAQFEERTGRNMQVEVAEALTGAAQLAAEDPDAFAAAAIDWQGLEEDPIRWAGGQAPDIVIEVLTGGAAKGITSTRRAARAAANAANAADLAPPRIPPPPRSPSSVVNPADVRPPTQQGQVATNANRSPELPEDELVDLTASASPTPPKPDDAPDLVSVAAASTPERVPAGVGATPTGGTSPDGPNIGTGGSDSSDFANGSNMDNYDDVELDAVEGKAGDGSDVDTNSPPQSVQTSTGLPSGEFPSSVDELSDLLGTEATRTETIQGTERVRWEPNELTRITYESHPDGLLPEDVGFNPRHHGPHYHVQVRPDASIGWNNSAVEKLLPPGYEPGSGKAFLPGEELPQ